MDRAICTGGVLASLLALVLGLTSTSIAKGTLPDERRYELVTPVSKNAADVVADPAIVRAAEDGSAVQYTSLTGFADVLGVPGPSEYLAVRGSDGTWGSHAITPPQEPTSYTPDISPNTWVPHYQGEFSSDLSHGVFLAKTPLTDAPNVAHAINLYLRSDLRIAGRGAYQLLTDASSDQGAIYNARIRPEFVGASADYSHVVFESKRNLVADAATLSSTAPKVYAWVNGDLRLIGMIPSAPDTECGGAGPTCTPTTSEAGLGALTRHYTSATVSENGQRIVFVAENGNVYLRDDHGTPATVDDTTTQINASERTDCSGDLTCGGNGIPDPMPDTSQPATFWVASNDESKLFLTTTERLSDDDPNSSSDLYRYDYTAQGSRLTRVSVDTEPSDNQASDLANGHNVAGALGASEDGNTVYFATSDPDSGQLIANGSTTPPVGNGGAAGGARIYRWHQGVLHEVGAINRDFELDADLGTPGWPRAKGSKFSRVSPDGRYLAFITQGTDQLLSHYGKPEKDHGAGNCAPFGVATACLQVYIYDADANNGNGDLQCASCNPRGIPPESNAAFYLTFSTGTTESSSHLGHPLANNGLLFFDSAEQLASDDENVTFDVYEFNRSTEQVHLLSSGRGKSRQIFLDATPDGNDVYIWSRAKLRSQDHDQSADIYDARVNGAVDPGTPIVHTCEEVTEEGCRPAAAPTARANRPASEFFQGPGSGLSPPNPFVLFHVQPLSRRQRHRLATRGSTRLTVSTSGTGAITVRLKVRVGGQTRTIQVIRRKLEHSGVIHPRIRLSGRARRVLASQGRLRLGITTTYSQVPTPQRLRVTLHTH